MPNPQRAFRSGPTSSVDGATTLGGVFCLEDGVSVEGDPFAFEEFNVYLARLLPHADAAKESGDRAVAGVAVGYDPVSMTGLVAGGCTLGAFTTGRGSVYGCKPAPCLKIATNTALYERMMDDMDLNAGTILDGTETVEQVGRRIFEALLAVAGGEKTKSEVLGLGDEEFAPWILGPTF